MVSETLTRGPVPAAARVRAPHLTGAGVTARISVLVALACVAILPAVLSTGNALSMIQVPIYAIVGLGLNVLVGYTGQLSLGQWAFVGVGALTAGNVADTGIVAGEPVHFAVSLLAAALAGAGVALVLGAVALRVTGLYLALVTLVFGVVVGTTLLQVPSLNGNGAGVKVVRPLALATPLRFYLFCLLLVAVLFLLDRRLSASKAGRAMLALKENERVAQAFGVNVVSVKLLAFAIAGGTAALAGGLFAFTSQQFSSKDFTGTTYTQHTLTFVVLVVVGGLGDRAGVLVASAFFGVVDVLIKGLFGSLNLENFYQSHAEALPGLIGALLLLQTVIANPGGLGGLVRPIGRWLAGGRFSLHGHGPGAVAAVDGSATRA